MTLNFNFLNNLSEYFFCSINGSSDRQISGGFNLTKYDTISPIDNVTTYIEYKQSCESSIIDFSQYKPSKTISDLCNQPILFIPYNCVKYNFDSTNAPIDSYDDTGNRIFSIQITDEQIKELITDKNITYNQKLQTDYNLSGDNINNTRLNDIFDFNSKYTPSFNEAIYQIKQSIPHTNIQLNIPLDINTTEIYHVLLYYLKNSFIFANKPPVDYLNKPQVHVLFTADSMIELIQQIDNASIQHQYIDNSSICMIYDLNGDLDRLVKILYNLYVTEYFINNTNKLKDDKYIFILGNFIADGPFNIEINAILFKLKKENPTNILIIKGQNEINMYNNVNGLLLENIMEYPYDLVNKPLVKLDDRIKNQTVIKSFFELFNNDTIMDTIISLSDKDTTTYILYNNNGVSKSLPLQLCLFNQTTICSNIVVGVKIYYFGDNNTSNKQLNNDITIIERLSNEFVITKITPHLILYIRKYETNTNDILQISENKLQIFNYVHTKKQKIVITEWADMGTLYENKNIICDHFNIFLFQLLYTLHVIRFKYPDFRHRDLHAENILVSKTNNISNGYFVYKLDDKTYYIPDVGFQIKIWDFDRSNLTSEISSVVMNEKINNLNHSFYDLYRIIYILHPLKQIQSDNLKQFYNKYIGEQYIPESIHKYNNSDTIIRTLWIPLPSQPFILPYINFSILDIINEESTLNGLLYSFLTVQNEPIIIDTYEYK